MNEKMKSFFEWFFRDNIVIPYPRIDEGTKRLGQVLTVLISVGCLLFYVFAAVHDGPRVYGYAMFLALITPICAWVGYKVYRRFLLGIILLSVWVVDGFRKPKE